MTDMEKMLGYVALNPSLFGFADQPTCVVNTAYFLPSLRSRPRGVWAFGTERGCKSIIVPSSLNQENFDKLDAQLIEPLFRWNPGVEYVYLSQYCQPMAAQLAPALARCHRLREVTLEGWNDAAAIHRLVMACKHAEVLDTYSPDDPPREWKSELSVQALATLIEMHPRLRAVKSHRLYLGDWYEATQFSRCKHNIALVPFSCDWILLHHLLFLMVLCVPSYAVYRLIKKLCVVYSVQEAYVWFWSVMAFLFTFASLVVFDTIGWKYQGRGWVHMQKYFILLKRRVDIAMNVHQTSLAKLH
ncbi:hypothetical protein STCU_01516 [Strigomonas culicis]|nr:hypothetical protein STCU_01516 [Strigomonas culicis]|eukprot:EPY34577.1 hypothetical protein STCU_01516 [Strigomonas culicis]